MGRFRKPSSKSSFTRRRITNFEDSLISFITEVVIMKRSFAGTFTQLISIITILIVVNQFASGQILTDYDRGTPPQLTAGVSPFGSYISTELGNINLANGGVNFSIPLGMVGGRGLWIPLTLNYSSKVWSGGREDHSFCDDNGSCTQWTDFGARYGGQRLAMGRPFTMISPGWTLGSVPVLHLITFGMQPFSDITRGCPINPPQPVTIWNYMLTKITLQMPDGAEIEFRDDIVDGVR